MTTKVTGPELASASIGGGNLPPASRGSAPGGSGAQSPSTSTSSSDVQITSAAAQLAALEQSLMAQPVVDPGRVAAASDAIASGSYAVQPEKVALGLMKTEQALAGLFGAKG
ncbi:MAG TPA: flagellar biosynthesis anti-sigma factor FlgM [Steroidobacteraceae bacterium]|nr:flagellar biosynthesis anti-sigma factor FlgM [Steroidobacteraceae bacterium]